MFGYYKERLRMPPSRKIIKQIAGQSKLNFGKSKYVLNFISFECQTRIADKLSCRIGRIGNHRPILSSLLITLHLAPLALADESANAPLKGTNAASAALVSTLFGTFWISKTSWTNKKSIPVEFR